MQISNAAWRAFLQPASYGGAAFKVEVGGQAGGRRNVTHEFPERDTPFTEDMGRRARRYPVTGYVIVSPTNSNYLPARDALIAACEAYGPSQLVHPTLGTMLVNCDTYAVSETRERGGIATFEMVFIEAGALTETGATVNTSAMATAAANAAGQAVAQGLDTTTQALIGSI